MVIIAGPGKCGGSLLMSILTELGMDTGYSKDVRTNISPKRKGDVGGNYEWQTRGTRARVPFPYIIKEPQMCADIDLRIEKFKTSYDIDVDHIYILLRRPGPVAPALAFLERNYPGPRNNFERGLSGKDLANVEMAFAKRILQVVHFTAEMDIPSTLISYPRYAADPNYAYQKLSFLMEKYDVSFDQYNKAAKMCVNKDLIDRAYQTMPEWVRAEFREKYHSKRRI